jgi:thiol:disulfide interchange protein
MDPQQTQQYAGMIAGMMGVFAIIGFAFLAFAIFLFWRIFTKASAG